MDDYILWLDQIKKDQFNLVGGKGFNLGIITQMDLPVPEGFVVTTKAFDEFLEKTKIKDEIYDLLKDLNVEDTEKLLEISKKIKELIVSQDIPLPIKTKIVEAYRALSYSNKIINKTALQLIAAGRSLALVAVRSSATAEDLPGASFAGQQATFLNVKGVKDLIDSVKKCWASLFEPRAIFYRAKHGIKKSSIAVIIQRMVNSDSSGVMFTIDPTTGEDNIVIEACWGLGETLVQGEVEPDRYIVTKEGKILEKKIGHKEIRRIRDFATEKTIKVPVPKELMDAQVLTEKEIMTLAQYGLILEQHYNHPQDVEFAVERGRVYLVQTRAVTTEAKPEEGKKIAGEPILKGLGASPGIATGKVKIVHGLDDISKVEKGDVLVTTMTSPDLVPTMSKCSAIITDSGGMTCFAGDTLVLTNRGFISIRKAYERILNKEKLYILSYDCKTGKTVWKKVIGAGKRISKCIRISVSQKGGTNNTIDLTPDHKMYTFERRKLVKKEIGKILAADEMLCLVDKIPMFEVGINDEKLAYLVGAILSDGYLAVRLSDRGNPKSGRVVFTQKVTQEKTEFIRTIKKYFQDVFHESFNLERVKTSSNILKGRMITGTATDFICTKLTPALQLTKITQNLVPWVLALSEDACLSFIAGLADGDGTFFENRLQIFVSKKNVLEGLVVACLKLGIVPQVTTNRSIFDVQIVERIQDILQYTKRIKGNVKKKVLGTKLFATKQIFSDIINHVNWKGRIKPYVKGNLLIDSEKVRKRVLPLTNQKEREELLKVLNSDLRMYRVRKVADIGEREVFNLEVDAEDEMEKNFVVFTKRFTPLLVSNSHAAIVSREMEIPCIVGTETATTTLKDGQTVTVDAYHGLVYPGEISIKKPEEKAEVSVEEAGKLRTKTKIYMNLGVPEKIEEYKKLPFDGIGLMRIEFIITSQIGEHPNYLIETGQQQKFIDKLAEGIAKVASAIAPRPVVVRFSDFKTNEYRDLKGGEKYEPEENNPMLGWRGVSRYISPEFENAFRLECKAVKKVRDELNLRNVWVMLPFVRTTWEVEKCLEIMKSEGLEREEGFKVWLMAEVPSVVFLADEFSKLCDGFSIGSNDMTGLLLGVDRDSELLGKMGYFDERNPAVLRAIVHLIKVAHRNNTTVSICGQAPSEFPEFTEFLVRNKIDSVSVNPDVVSKTRKLVYDIEKKIEMEEKGKFELL